MRKKRIGAIATRSACALSFCALAGCSDLLEVENTRDILAEDLKTVEAIPALMNGVAGDFAWTFMQAALTTGLSANEFQHVGSNTALRELENGYADNTGSVGTVFNRASRAHFVAENAVTVLRRLLPDADSRPETARARIYSGFTLLLLADNFCVVTLNGEAPIQPAAVYQKAEAYFSEAMAIAGRASNAALLQTAQAGRARARLMLGNFAGARDDAKTIPATFKFVALYSENSARENNAVATSTVATIRKEVSVHPSYYNDSRYPSDPRTPFLNKGPRTVGTDAIRQYVEQTRYPGRAAPANIASGMQARLIEAEAELKLGNLDRAVALINEVRANAKLAPYTGARTVAEVTGQLMYERSAEMWLEAQRYSDLRRTQDPFLRNRVGCYPLSFEEEQSNLNVRK